MIKNEKDSVYLITHSYGEVIDGITYDEESAKYFVDKMNEKYPKLASDDPKDNEDVVKIGLKKGKKLVITQKFISIVMVMGVDAQYFV